jgi:2-polyprenyl-6-hydroxyphenyl methylase/3-demethylubiquinone-9 3-methyltransferase
MTVMELNLLLTFLRGLNPLGYVRYWTEYSRQSVRGMNRWHDIVDWVGGYPFEVAKPAEIMELFRQKGFHATRLETVRGGSGCNQFVFTRDRLVDSVEDGRLTAMLEGV